MIWLLRRAAAALCWPKSEESDEAGHAGHALVVNIHTAATQHWTNEDESELIDNDGYVCGQGDPVMLDEATQHSSTAPNGWLIAVFVRTLERDLPD